MAITIDETTQQYPIGTVIIDGYRFDKIGYGKLQTANTVKYVESPKRSNSGALYLDNYDTYVLPQCEIGFSLIDIERFILLRKLLLSKKEHFVNYFDADFGIRVEHRMTVDEDKLKTFFSLGSRVIGMRDYSIKFVSTLSPWEAYGVKIDSNGGALADLSSVAGFALNTAYGLGDKVSYNGKIYVCTAAHTPDSANQITVNDKRYWRFIDTDLLYKGLKCAINKKIVLDDYAGFLTKSGSNLLYFCDAVDESGKPAAEALYFFKGEVLTVTRDITLYAVWG